MELLVKRTTRTETSTIGKFSINGEFFAYSLEDKDSGLTSDMSPDQIAAIKVHGQTAIPTGRYQVVKYFSPKHQAFLPLLLNVPGFEFVEIHVGNKAEDTDGCLLLGNSASADFISGSKDTINKLYPPLFAALDRNEQIWIVYE